MLHVDCAGGTSIGTNYIWIQGREFSKCVNGEICLLNEKEEKLQKKREELNKFNFGQVGVCRNLVYIAFLGERIKETGSLQLQKQHQQHSMHKNSVEEVHPSLFTDNILRTTK